MTLSSQFGLLRGPSLISVTGKYHGLGNRLRSVLGGYTLAKFEGRRFGYVWPTDKNFGAGLNDLWDFKMPTVPVNVSRLFTHAYPYRNHTLDWHSSQVREERLWQIKTAHALHLPSECPPWESELRKLTPTAPVAAYVNKTSAEQSSSPFPYIGVMIRTNPISHELTLRHSPLDWYITRMREIRAMWPGVPFYIAADTPDAFRVASAAIEGCFGQADKGKYNSREAVSASVGDLYMLASSVHVLGPYYSSFPELAQLMAGSDLCLETSMSPAEFRLENRHSLTLPPNPLRPFTRAPMA